MAKDRLAEGAVYDPGPDIHLWRTLLTDQFPQPDSKTLTSRMLYEPAALNYLCNELSGLVQYSDKALQQPPFDSALMRTLRTVASNKAFCTSTIPNSAVTGLLLAAPEVRVDDCIFVARGCSYPLIVRPASKRGSTHKTDSCRGKGRSDRESYSLVGCAAIAGMMDVEVIDAIAAGDLEEEELVLV